MANGFGVKKMAAKWEVSKIEDNDTKTNNVKHPSFCQKKSLVNL